MPFVLFLLAILVLTLGPRLWVKRTMSAHGYDRPDLPGSGGQLAEHLIERYELEGVTVHKGNIDENYYNPVDKQVSLSPEIYDGRSISAVAVAAHELGHAIQDKEHNPDFLRRNRRIKQAMSIERFSSMALLITPLVFMVTKVPHSMLITGLIGITGMLAAIWVQFLNLPVEMDASFNKALPILAEGYISDQDIPAARQVLKAAAYTYVAGALASIFNLARWVAILRR